MRSLLLFSILALLSLPAPASAQKFGVEGNGVLALGYGQPGGVALTSTGAIRSVTNSIGSGTGIQVLGLDASGNGDSTFGTKGLVTIPIKTGTFGTTAHQFGSSIGIGSSFGGPSTHIAVDGEGRVLVAALVTSYREAFRPGLKRQPSNWAVVIRLLADGTIDSSYGKDGGAVVPLGIDTGRVSAFAVAGDGSAYVGGVTEVSGAGHPAVWRLTPKGVLDTKFGKKGVTSWKLHNSKVTTLAIAADGRAIVGTSEDYTKARLHRLTKTGAVDTKFGTKGTRDLNLETGLQALALDSSGRIVVASGGGGAKPAEIRRITANGADDATFAAGKPFMTDASTENIVTSLAIATDGRLWALTTQVKRPATTALVALTDAGVRDTTIGAGKPIAVTDRFNKGVSGMAVLRRADGSLLTYSDTTGNGGTLMSVALFTDQGNPVGLAPPAPPVTSKKPTFTSSLPTLTEELIKLGPAGSAKAMVEHIKKDKNNSSVKLQLGSSGKDQPWNTFVGCAPEGSVAVIMLITRDDVGLSLNGVQRRCQGMENTDMGQLVPVGDKLPIRVYANVVATAPNSYACGCNLFIVTATDSGRAVDTALITYFQAR